MIRCYCFHDIDHGIRLLKGASDRGFVRATYTLGLLLRDLRPREARRYMVAAAEAGYFPALQEVLPAGDLKAKSGEPTAGELCQYLDPTSLNRLLRRHYVRCPHLRNMNTSHCWNPLCGKWAYRVPREGSPDKFGNGRMKSMVSFGTTLGARALRKAVDSVPLLTRMSRMKVCSRCGRAMYCSKLCQVYDWRSGRHKIECPFL
jgi:MYND finger